MEWLYGISQVTAFVVSTLVTWIGTQERTEGVHLATLKTIEYHSNMLFLLKNNYIVMTPRRKGM